MAEYPTTERGGSDRHRDLVVIGGSAGCIEGLCKEVFPGLPEEFPAAICVVLHMSPQSPRVLDAIWGRNSRLPVQYALNGAALLPGQIYIAPPGYHLLVAGSKLALNRGPHENLHRPAGDPLFSSAAEAYGERVVGVVLTGNLDDGTRGSRAVKERGGVVVVQDPRDALYRSMPESVLRHVGADHCLPMSQLAPLLVRLTQEKLSTTIREDPAGRTAKSTNARDSACYSCQGSWGEG